MESGSEQMAGCRKRYKTVFGNKELVESCFEQMVRRHKTVFGSKELVESGSEQIAGCIKRY